MTIIISILSVVLVGYLIYKYWFFRPETNIYYLVKLFNAEYRSIAIVGDPDDNSELTPLIRPFEKVEPFTFRFQKLVTRTEATKNNWPISFEFPGDPKVIVERTEEMPGWRPTELLALGIEAVTGNGTDISIGLEAAYKPLPGNGPVLMKKTVKNWSAFAESQIQSLISAWVRKQKSDEEILKISTDDIMYGIANEILKNDPEADPHESVLAYLNQKFEKKGFRIDSMALYKVVNGPQSQDVKNTREAIKKRELELEIAELDRQIKIKEGMADVELQNNEYKNHATYIERLNKSRNLTILEATRNMRNLQTLVVSDGFSTESFTGAKVATQRPISTKFRSQTSDSVRKDSDTEEKPKDQEKKKKDDKGKGSDKPKGGDK